MTQHKRLLLGLLLPVVLLCSAVDAGASVAAVSPAMTGLIDEDNTLDLTFADGTEVGGAQLPGPVIPAGTYQVVINDLSQVGDFDLAGPSVSLSTGVEVRGQASWTVALLPCALYSYRNDQQGTSTHWFQTSASATSGAACPPPLAGGPSGQATTTTTAVGATSGKSRGSAGGLTPGSTLSAIGTVIPLEPLRGVLQATVNASGKPALTFDGKPVSRLRPGRYSIEATDDSAKASLILKKAHGKPVTITGGSFVGRHKLTLELSTGTWSFSVAAPTRRGPSLPGGRFVVAVA